LVQPDDLADAGGVGDVAGGVDFGADELVLHGEAGGSGLCGFLLDEGVYIAVVEAKDEAITSGLSSWVMGPRLIRWSKRLRARGRASASRSTPRQHPKPVR
jgi:hypothetical protein